jgi:threonine/homoserine/homoserine lactone efflux protein
MTTSSAIISFSIAAGLLTITPGLDTALVLRTAAVEGSRKGFAAATGICAGVMIWGIVVAIGIAALLSASRIAYDIMRYAGAAYLIYLGAQMLLRPRRDFMIDEETPSRSGSHAWFIRGLMTNLLNPKVGVFYVSFLPQFIPSNSDPGIFSVMLAAIHATEGIVWFTLLLIATRPILGRLRSPGVVTALDRVTGVVLCAFAARLALKAR